MSVGEQLPILVKPPYPMLARVGTVAQLATAIADGYLIEPKLDGIRCLATVDAVAGQRTVRLFNRQLVDITARFPDVVEWIKLTTHENGVTLDGEIFVWGENGPDFQLVQTRANRVRNIAEMAERYPAHYSAFDMLRCNDNNIMRYTLIDRRRMMFEVCGQLVVTTYTQQEANDRQARQLGEGLMLKHASSKYEPGARSPGWLKVKWLREVEAVVGGLTYGIGKRATTFGGLLVGVPLPEDREGKGRLKYIGTVGTGFTEGQLATLTTRLTNLRTTDCPFTTRGSDWDLRHFVQPVTKVRVAFAEYTREGIMRFPRFVELL